LEPAVYPTNQAAKKGADRYKADLALYGGIDQPNYLASLLAFATEG
jgi:hypothetical protein